MKIKRKLIVIWIILVLLSTSMITVQAGETDDSTGKENSIFAEITFLNSDGTFSQEKLKITESELNDFKEAILELIDEIGTIEDMDSILQIIKRFSNSDSILFNKVFEDSILFKLLKKRPLVISSGHGIDYSPLKRISFKLRKRICTWHYNSNTVGEDRTLIIQPSKLRFKNIEGPQLGIMSRFTGVYLSTSKGFMKQSYTFFIGKACHVSGFQLAPSI